MFKNLFTNEKQLLFCYSIEENNIKKKESPKEQEN
jgi:hypothetical protein